MHTSRVIRPKRTTQQTYDRLSPIYHLLSASSEGPLTHLGIVLLAVQPGESVLEIGPGAGSALVELCQCSGLTGRVHGIDLSRGMLKQSRGRLTRAHLEKTISLHQGDGTALPYPARRYNAIFLSFTLELFSADDIPLVLGECRRVLRPGGRLGIVCLHRSQNLTPVVRLYEWFHARFPSLVDCRPIDAAALIQDAGFIIQKRILESMWGLPVEIALAIKA
jgi:demethylmenaquinone methyltransferase/2-methoxy-6-polyprenyl-1,4-benzoquinol methylase